MCQGVGQCLGEFGLGMLFPYLFTLAGRFFFLLPTKIEGFCIFFPRLLPIFSYFRSRQPARLLVARKLETATLHPVKWEWMQIQNSLRPLSCLTWLDRPRHLSDPADWQRWLNRPQRILIFFPSKSLLDTCRLHSSSPSAFLFLFRCRHLNRQLFLYTSSALVESLMRLCGNTTTGITPLEGRPIFSLCVVSYETLETDRLLPAPYGPGSPCVHASWDADWNCLGSDCRGPHGKIFVHIRQVAFI